MLLNGGYDLMSKVQNVARQNVEKITENVELIGPHLTASRRG
jgi:hypothetical protein